MAARKNAVGRKSSHAKQKSEIEQRLEYVRIITRTKSTVCNWHDLERQIMKGAI